MKIDNPPPFQEFDCYKIFHKKMGRWQVCMKNPKTGERKTLLYGKFLLSIKEGRILTPNEEVDHIYGNKLDDNPKNLEIVTRAENCVRRINRTNRKTVELICPHCKKLFKRERRQTHIIKGGTKSCCTRSCAAKHQFSGL